MWLTGLYHLKGLPVPVGRSPTTLPTTCAGTNGRPVLVGDPVLRHNRTARRFGADHQFP